MAKVMVAGHICLDITPTFRSRHVAPLSDILTPGKLIQTEKADIHTGGAVSNTGLALSFFGVDTTLAAKVGNDYFSQIIREILSKHPCSVRLIEDKSSSSSYSIVLAPPGIDRSFLHNPGANNTFDESDISDDMLDGVTHFHFGYPTLMRRMYQDDGKPLADMFKRIRAKGITTSLDMAAVDPDSEAGRVDWLSPLSKTLPYVDFYMPSIEETAYMLDKEKLYEWKQRSRGADITEFLSPEKDVRPFAKQLIDLGAKVVLLKCGALGMFYKTAPKSQLAQLCKLRGLNVEEWSGQEGFEQSYLQENIVSGTGAGDTSIAAFLASMMNGNPLLRCVQLAAAAGACCISAHDALSGLESLEALTKRIDSGWEKRPFPKN